MNSLWKSIIEVHGYVKKYIILAEELGTGYESNMQPVLELRSGFDHVIRAESKDYRDNKQLSEEDRVYVKHNLEKALGHVYRAFFDTSDWLATELRKKYFEIISKYSPDIISKAFPEYYISHKPLFEEVSKDIVRYRINKDISKDERVLGDVENYAKTLDKIIELYKVLMHRLPSLEEIYLREIKKEKKTTAISTVGIVFGAIGVIGVVLTIVLFVINTP